MWINGGYSQNKINGAARMGLIQPQTASMETGPLMSAVCVCSGDVRVLLSARNTNTHQSPTAVLVLCLASNLAM